MSSLNIGRNLLNTSDIKVVPF